MREGSCANGGNPQTLSDSRRTRGRRYVKSCVGREQRGAPTDLTGDAGYDYIRGHGGPILYGTAMEGGQYPLWSRFR